MGLTNHFHIYLALEPCDMRKFFNGLAALAEKMKPAALKNGGLFLFTNKRRNRFKALYYDHTGVCVLAKRLEVWPTLSEPGQQELNLTPKALQKPWRSTQPKKRTKPQPELSQGGRVSVAYMFLKKSFS